MPVHSVTQKFEVCVVLGQHLICFVPIECPVPVSSEESVVSASHFRLTLCRGSLMTQLQL